MNNKSIESAVDWQVLEYISVVRRHRARNKFASGGSTKIDDIIAFPKNTGIAVKRKLSRAKLEQWLEISVVPQPRVVRGRGFLGTVSDQNLSITV